MKQGRMGMANEGMWTRVYRESGEGGSRTNGVSKLGAHMGVAAEGGGGVEERGANKVTPHRRRRRAGLSNS